MEPFALIETDLNVGNADYAYDTIREWEHRFKDEKWQDEDFDNFDELILLLEACRLRALRVLSRPGHKEAVEALAHAILAPEGITGKKAEKLVHKVIAKSTCKDGIEM